MKLSIALRKVNLPEAAADHLQVKIAKLEKFFAPEAEVVAKFSYEKDKKICELTVQHQSMFFRSEEKEDDYIAAIDKAFDKLVRQIRKNKTKLEKRMKSGAFEKEELFAGVSEPEELDFELIKTKRFHLKPMSVDEAILQMNQIGHTFFVFKSLDGLYSVVYKRHNGGYGVIESL